MKKIELLLISLIVSVSVFSQNKNTIDRNQGTYFSLYKVDTLHKNKQVIDVLLYNVSNLQIVPEKKLIRADISLSVKAMEDLDGFYLDFHNSYHILSLKINDTIADWKFEDDNCLYIKPENRINKGATFIIDIKYFNTKKIKVLWDNTMYNESFIFSTLPISLLFPSNNVLYDRAMFKMNIAVPKNYELVTFGVKRPVGKNKFIIESKSTLSVDNFNLNLLKGYRKFSIDGPRVGKGLSARVQINQYTPVDSTIRFRNLITNIPTQMAFLDSILGYYPSKELNVITTKNIIRNKVLNGRNTIIIPNEYVKDSTEVYNKLLNGLVKQWYGNKVGVREPKDLWITEGIARYIEWLLIEQQIGKVKFNIKMNAKLVEAKKYMGLIDWHLMNPYPLYSYDLHNVVYNFGELSKDKIIKGDSIRNLYKIISLDPEKVSDSVKESFKNKFGHDIAIICDKGHSYYELMSWAKEQGPGNFTISNDGFYTLKSIQNKKFETHIFKLADPGEHIGDFTIPIRGALFIHFLRLQYGDEVFFAKVLDFATKYSGMSLSTNYFIKKLDEETNNKVHAEVKKWLFSETEIPPFMIFK
jgi:hypothetical protein